jgi:hypothetical protein
MSDGFRFEPFADAPSAQAAFHAIYPVGSPIAPALQALVDMGAQCRQASPTKYACRYMEGTDPLLKCCWHVVLETGNEKNVRAASIALVITGP